MSEKTEQPTEKRIRDSREKGQFLFSREIVAGSLLIALTALFLLSWKPFAILAITMLDVTLLQIGKHFNHVPPHTPDFQQGVSAAASIVAVFFITISGAVYLVAAITAILANVAQTGLVFVTAKLTKGVKALDFISNAKQIFSGRNLFNFGMNLIKVFCISYIAFLVVAAFIGEFFSAELCGAQGMTCVIFSAARSFAWLFAISAALYVPLAVIDFIIQRAFYLKELKMTKEEVKQEYKEMEGNPEIKAHRRQAHRDILDDTMIGAVKQASILVKNPSHYAVALLYDGDKTPLPLVIGKGEGAVAQAMIKAAEDANIPIYENVNLAQGLFHDIELGHYITSDFIAPVAEALHYIEQAKQNI